MQADIKTLEDLRNDCPMDHRFPLTALHSQVDYLITGDAFVHDNPRADVSSRSAQDTDSKAQAQETRQITRADVERLHLHYGALERAYEWQRRETAHKSSLLPKANQCVAEREQELDKFLNENPHLSRVNVYKPKVDFSRQNELYSLDMLIEAYVR